MLSSMPLMNRYGAVALAQREAVTCRLASNPSGRSSEAT